MFDSDTTWGGARRDFMATAWSRILVSGDASPEERRTRLEALARQYWKPLYVYIRCRWKKSNHEAKDLTQGFFAWMVESDFFAKARADRGRFRDFVKTSLDYFVRDAEEARRALKRGGGRLILNLDFIAGGEAEPASVEPPDKILDAEWRRTLIQQALDMLRDMYESGGRDDHYRLFEESYLSPEPRPSYKELAERYGLTPVDVKNRLTHARSRFRELLEHLAAEGVGHPDDLRRELDELFGGAGPA